MFCIALEVNGESFETAASTKEHLQSYFSKIGVKMYNGTIIFTREGRYIDLIK